MIRRIVPLLLLVVISAPALAADKVDAKKLKGTWTREADGNKISFVFNDGKSVKTLLQPAGADAPVEIESDITLSAEGEIAGTITKIDAKGAEGLPNKGDKWSFKVEVGKETLIISGFKGPGEDGARQLVEGEYKKKG